MGLLDDEEKKASSYVPDADEIEFEREKSANKAVVVGSLLLAGAVGLVVADIEPGLLDPSMQRISKAIGTALGVLIFAGIPSAIAAKFTSKWRYVWIVIAALLLLSQVVVYFYEKKA